VPRLLVPSAKNEPKFVTFRIHPERVMGNMSPAANTKINSNAFTAARGKDHIYFRPQLFYQPLFEEHLADAGLEFRMNFSTGSNEARFNPNIKGLEAIDSCPDRLKSKKAAALHLIPKDQARGAVDISRVRSKLILACTWGEVELVKQIICTCWVTSEAAGPALAEACARGHLNVIKILLKAGTPPNYKLAGQNGKTPLHICCETGNMEQCELLLEAMPFAGAAYTICNSGETAFDLARRLDMKGFARRLEEKITAVEDSKHKNENTSSKKSLSG